MRNKTDISLGTQLTIIAGSAIGASGVAVAACLPEMKIVFQNIPHSDFLVKSIFTLPSLFAGISSFFIGILLDKWGRKPVIMIALLLSVIGAVGFVAESLYLILASRIFVGVGIGGALTGFSTLIGDYFEGRRLDKLMALQSASMMLGSVFFLTLGGILTDINWRFIFLIYGAPLPVLVGVWLFVDEPKIRKKSDYLDAKQTLPKSLNPVFTLAFLSGLASCMIFVYTPFHLRSFGASGTQISLAVIASLCSGAAAAMFYQKLRQYFSFQKILTICFLSIAAGFFIVAMSDSYYKTILGMLIVGPGLGFFMPTLNILTVSLASSSNRGRAVGLLNIYLSIGPFFGLIILQLIVQQIGLSWTFATVGILTLGSIAPFGSLIKKIESPAGHDNIAAGLKKEQD